MKPWSERPNLRAGAPGFEAEVRANTPPEDPRFRVSNSPPSTVPRAVYPVAPGSPLRATDCVHCQSEIGVSTWEHLNGFLVQCPHCLGFHGKPWHLSRPLLAGFFFNFLSFFFTMRPARALLTTIGFGTIVFALALIAGPNMENQEVAVVAMTLALLGPLVINGALLVRHQVLLDRAPPTRDHDSDDSSSR